MRHRLVVTGVLAGAVVVATAVALPSARRADQPAEPPVAAEAAIGRHTSLDAAIGAAQRRLTSLPGDWSAWAFLGSAYVEQARIAADPSYYPKADAALNRSLTLRGDDNWQALVGLGALANARHDFASALSWGRRAEKINAFSGPVYGVIADALTQLGDYPAARDAIQRMLNVAPGVASFTRASYDLEIHGQTTQARDALDRALQQASDPADVAFCHFYLGELAFNNGNPSGALTHYQAALNADPRYHMARAGMGKARAALGQTDQALRDYEQAVDALPLPQLLVEYGDTLAAAGEQTQAQQQYDLVTAELALLAANGVTDHLLMATFLADHQQPDQALTHAQTEWAARRSVLAADALAWALHRTGRDSEALAYAERANALGWNNATFLYHRGAIHQALGHRAAARADLTRALTINPHFDILQAPRSRQLLATLSGPA